MDEFEVIKKYFHPLTNGCAQANNLQDDIAEISVPQGYKLVISKDLIVEDVHFKREYGGYKIASKLLRSNLSDLAAAGAKPLYYMLGFSKSAAIDEEFISDFHQALKDISTQYGLCLIGGDSVSTSDKLFFSLTIFGQIKQDQSLNRNRAKSGDLVFVSGTIGDAFLGLQITQNKLPNDPYLLSRHYYPTPRIELGQSLVNANLAHAAIDVSDGLLADLKHICQASNLSASIALDAIPISSQARAVIFDNANDIEILDLICAGDDYELIFTAPPKNKAAIMQLAEQLNITITEIGSLQACEDNAKQLQLCDKNGQLVNMKNYGYKHY